MDGFFPPVPPRSDLALAVESLCRRYDTWFRDVLRRRYGDQADDLAHEAYLRTAAHEAQGKVQHPKAFLLNVANNLATDQRRREKRENDYATYRGAFPRNRRLRPKRWRWPSSRSCWPYRQSCAIV
jgi:DNA-directed RNA polymerase specialized sigma24 family protein